MKERKNIYIVLPLILNASDARGIDVCEIQNQFFCCIGFSRQEETRKKKDCFIF